MTVEIYGDEIWYNSDQMWWRVTLKSVAKSIYLHPRRSQPPAQRGGGH